MGYLSLGMVFDMDAYPSFRTVSAGTMEGETTVNRTHGAWPAYTAGNGQPGRDGGGTVVMASTDITNDDWENIFGPGARDIKFNTQAYKRDGRLHLPSVLEGVNHYLTDRIDGLITDATNSPFTTVILPYTYLNNPDAKFTWNRYSFDEGLANRVPYESAARTLAQTRRSYEGYTVRQGLAITMEHNFMMSPAGRENFFNKWWQVVGSIQKTNDLDVHIALLSAPSYAMEVKNKYYSRTKTPHQIIREHIDMFGFMQKNVNALDILIEDAKITLQGWGSPGPSFMLCNSKLTMQLTMTPEKTNFITQGYDGIKRLKQGPMLDSYRGLNIIHSRQYSLETGAPPRDLLRRRVRVAEYYRIPWQTAIGPNGENVMVDLYDESRDTFFTISWKDLLNHAALDDADRVKFENLNTNVEVADVHAFAAVCGAQFVMGNVMGGIANPNVVPGDFIAVLRPVDIRGNVVQGLGGFTLPEANAVHPGPIPDDRSGLLLVTNKRKYENNMDLRTRFEHQSFYTGSGWFNGVASVAGRQQWIYKNNFVQWRLPVPQGAGVGYSLDERKAVFKMLAYGMKTAGNALSPRIQAGFRPNLHIGSMVYASKSPDTMRFKHVAAHIVAQTVVTRSLAIRLMQKVQLDPNEHNDVLRNGIMYLFGIHTRMYPANRRSPPGFDPTNCALAYMAAAVLHPDGFIREKCASVLKETLKWNIEDIGNDLVTWFKVFLNTMPTPNGGAESPPFNALAMGRSLAETFIMQNETADPEKDENGILDQEKRDALPVMYLGEFIDPAKVNDKFQVADGFDFGTYANVENPPKWKDNGNRDLAMNRDVMGTTFTSTAATVFPVGKGEKVAKQDIIAVNQTAGAQDALIAFVQIMCKRFFTSDQELYVETHEKKDDKQPNTALVNGDYGGITRRALTSNEYIAPYMGKADDLKSDAEKWEIVIVRPNIEHNMLAAVLGRGGSEDLGSTFWGQTELSCYDDSMHGVWGMSYKYHERAIVTNEKNLIRLFDVAYDGYNGGKDDTFVSWTADSGHRSFINLKAETANTTMPYTGPSIMVMAFPVNVKDKLWERSWPSPIVFHEQTPGKPYTQEPNYVLDPDNIERVFDERMRVFGQIYNRNCPNDPVSHKRYERYYAKMPGFTYMHTTKKSAGQAIAENESTGNSLAFQGTYRVWKQPGDNGGGGGTVITDIKGSGHHGVDYIGVASVRSGKGYKITGEGIQAVRQV